MKATKKQKVSSRGPSATDNSDNINASAATETAHIIITSKAKSGSMSIASELPFKDDKGQVWQYSESNAPGTITEVTINCHDSAGATLQNVGDNVIATIPITGNESQLLINFTRPDDPEQQLTPIIVKGGDDGSSLSERSSSGEQAVMPNIYIISMVPFSTPLVSGEGDDWHNSICQTAGYMTQVTVTLPKKASVTIEGTSNDFYIDMPVESGEVTIDISYNYTPDDQAANI